MAQLDRTGRMHGGDNRNCQRTLAESLVATLGHEGAVHVCRANTWDSVLAYVLSDKDAQQSSGNGTRLIARL